MKKRQCWKCERIRPAKKVVLYAGIENDQNSAYIALCGDHESCNRAGNDRFARALRKQSNRLPIWDRWLEYYRCGAGTSKKYDLILAEMIR